MFGLKDKLLLKNLEKTSKKIKNLKIFFDEKNSPQIKKIPKKQLHPIKNKKGLMHQKILVIDNKIVFLGSANMTKQSLSMHNNLIIGFYNKELASFLSKNTPFNSGNLLFSINQKPLDLYLLPDKNNKALNKLKEIIKSSSYSIKVVMFTLTHKDLTDELINAKKRGVDVKVFVDFRTSFGASKKAIKSLQEENVAVFLSQGVELLHHKYLYVDEKTLVFGSANWTKAAFHKNRDLFVIFHQISNKQKKFMNKLQKIIELESKQS
jgi:phosphatidylserine/phosphatidylglycerophosphate/cardiolipin synthase-like enzyme